MSQHIETSTVIALALMLGLALIGIVATFSQSTSNGNSLAGVHARLDDLENSKARATSRRWTADDQLEFMRCMRFPNLTPAREACLRTVEQRISNR